MDIHKEFKEHHQDIVCPMCEKKDTFVETLGDNLWCTNCSAPFDQEYIIEIYNKND